jgi:hypothetical protein
MTLAGSGTPNQPITLSSYGKGANPRILRNQAIRDICILLTDPSYWNISNLEVGQASVGILFHYTRVSNNGISMSNIYAHDNKGIWSGYSTQHPVSANAKDPFATGLNIDLSSGILFNIAPSLAFKDSEYVLKGVSLTDIRGKTTLTALPSTTRQTPPIIRTATTPSATSPSTVSSSPTTTDTPPRSIRLRASGAATLCVSWA